MRRPRPKSDIRFVPGHRPESRQDRSNKRQNIHRAPDSPHRVNSLAENPATVRQRMSSAPRRLRLTILFSKRRAGTQRPFLCAVLAVFFAGACFAAAFFAPALAATLLTGGAFFAGAAFLAEAFAGAFFAGAFLAAAFFATAFTIFFAEVLLAVFAGVFFAGAFVPALLAATFAGALPFIGGATVFEADATFFAAAFTGTATFPAAPFFATGVFAAATFFAGTGASV